MPLSKRHLRHSQSILKQTYQRLKTSILLGELASGQRLVELQLAEQLQISRTPVREALRLLQHDHLAVVDDRGIVRVASISAASATELYNCRMALEELAIREACQNATHEDLHELQYTLHQAEKLIENERKLFVPQIHADNQLQMLHYRLLDLDYQFHRLLARSSGNACLVTLLDQIFDKMLMLRIQTIKHNSSVLEIRLEHYPIYEALMQRNIEAGVEAIREHLMASKYRVVREVEQIQQAIEQSKLGQ